MKGIKIILLFMLIMVLFAGCAILRQPLQDQVELQVQQNSTNSGIMGDDLLTPQKYNTSVEALKKTLLEAYGQPTMRVNAYTVEGVNVVIREFTYRINDDEYTVLVTVNGVVDSIYTIIGDRYREVKDKRKFEEDLYN